MVKITRKRADGVSVNMTTSESQAKLYLASGIWQLAEGATTDANDKREVPDGEQSDPQESGEASQEDHPKPRKRRTQKTRKSAKDVIKEMTLEVGD